MLCIDPCTGVLDEKNLRDTSVEWIDAAQGGGVLIEE